MYIKSVVEIKGTPPYYLKGRRVPALLCGTQSYSLGQYSKQSTGRTADVLVPREALLRHTPPLIASCAFNVTRAKLTLTYIAILLPINAASSLWACHIVAFDWASYIDRSLDINHERRLSRGDSNPGERQPHGWCR